MNDLDQQFTSLMLEIGSDMERYESGGRLLTDDKAPVELLGMEVIDDLISEELQYYKKAFKEEGIKGITG